MKNIFATAILSLLLLATAAEAANLPAGLPQTTRRGDDLILRFGQKETAIKDLLYDIRQGQIALFYLRLPKHGKCALDVDWQGKIVAARCDGKPLNMGRTGGK